MMRFVWRRQEMRRQRVLIALVLPTRESDPPPILVIEKFDTVNATADQRTVWSLTMYLVGAPDMRDVAELENDAVYFIFKKSSRN